MTRLCGSLTLLLLLLILIPTLFAQSITTGDITGTVTDPTGAAIPGATVTLKNNQTGATQITTTNAQGLYRFALLPPGEYAVTITAQGFQAVNRVTRVAIGTPNAIDVQLALATGAQTVIVSETGELVQTENGNVAATFTNEQISQLPNSGQDITYIAQFAPGVTMNTMGGYGNFESFGLPATSNLFTVNGQSNIDPYFNINNSGATNLTLGNNELSEAHVVNNGYSGEYGQLAGSQVNYVTRSGGNDFHGNLYYLWNGRYVNGNDFFNNQAGVPRPFSNANEYGGSFGGPIIKNKTFFFFNYEGLRNILPNTIDVRIPSPQFQAATLANLAATGQSAQVPFYRQMFNLYNGAAGAGQARPLSTGTGCGSFSALGAGVPCVLHFQATPTGVQNEALWSLRGDQLIGGNDRVYARVQRDNGTQATYLDPINPAFSALSKQPEQQAQLNETHTFGARAVNNIILSGQYYSAKFGPPDVNAQRAVFPYPVATTGLYTVGRDLNLWPQGRNVTQYQVIDDYSVLVGRHSLKTGVNFIRYDISDYIFGRRSSGALTAGGLANLYNGVGSSASFLMYFPSAMAQPLAMYRLGAYLQDDWKVTPNLTISPALRIDHNSNPVCQHDCFARLSDDFMNLNHDPNVPYNQVIQTGLHQGFPTIDRFLWQPRLGFAWSPGGRGTVIRGGGGIFGEALPAEAAEFAALNPPELNRFTVRGGTFAPNASNSMISIARQANQSLIQGFNSGATFAQIRAASPFFSAPNYTSFPHQMRQARYYKWNFEIQQRLPWSSMFSVNYVGTRGLRIPLQDAGPNFFGVPGAPSTVPDPRFGIITELAPVGYSRYNGLVTSFLKRMTGGFTFQLNYTWSHALDDVSNGGFRPFNFLTDESLLTPQDPYNVHLYNWGNSDYDVRHYFSGSWVWDNAFRHVFHGGPNMVFGGWAISGTIIARSGLPFTVVDTDVTNALAAQNRYGGNIFATVLPGNIRDCNSSAVDAPCLAAANFAPSPASPAFGSQSRNQFRGPHFFDMDLSVTKNFPIRERMSIGIGAMATNLLNHPNFDMPGNDIADPGTLGLITSTLSPPTSILGSFVGAATAPRMIIIRGTLRF